MPRTPRCRRRWEGSASLCPHLGHRPSHAVKLRSAMSKLYPSERCKCSGLSRASLLESVGILAAIRS
eukprot:4656281-Amphidinium_carterae.1